MAYSPKNRRTRAREKHGKGGDLEYAEEVAAAFFELSKLTTDKARELVADWALASALERSRMEAASEAGTITSDEAKALNANLSQFWKVGVAAGVFEKRDPRAEALAKFHASLEGDAEETEETEEDTEED